MNKKLRDIVAAVALSLFQFAPYSAQATATQPKASSGIEAIVENSTPEISSTQYNLKKRLFTKFF